MVSIRLFFDCLCVLTFFIVVRSDRDSGSSDVCRCSLEDVYRATSLSGVQAGQVSAVILMSLTIPQEGSVIGRWCNALARRRFSGVNFCAHSCFDLKLEVLFCKLSQEVTEIKVLFVESQELPKLHPLKSAVGHNIAIHAPPTARIFPFQFYLPCPFKFICFKCSFHVILALGPLAGPWNKIFHPTRCDKRLMWAPYWVLTENK